MFAEYLAWHGAQAVYSRIARRRTTSTAARDIGTFVRDLSHA
jgi:hypothetical protein